VREIAVWTVHLDGLPTDGTLLDDEERRRWRRLRTAGLRDSFAAAHWVRRMVLADNLGMDPARLRFTSGPWGKPELADRALFHSFSHSRDMAMVAVSATDPVGVDIEAVRGDLPATRLARAFFRPSEARTVESAVDRPARYIRLWTRKEAAGKVTGICLDRTLRIDVGATGRGWSVSSASTAAGPWPGSSMSRPRKASWPLRPCSGKSSSRCGCRRFRGCRHPAWGGRRDR
jgi:4'-phosphopantetheinyl transferase